ncbi:MAG: hypothetical protein NTV81_01150 [Candidatus Komeilibacteria bacterium]|nr:hypothetical protein [Candidatus Komeilibacteria bacterium]
MAKIKWLFPKVLLIIYLLFLGFLVISPTPSQALNIVDKEAQKKAEANTNNSPLNFVPNIDIPGSTGFYRGVSTTAGAGTVSLLGQYIKSIYRFFVGVAAIIATFMIVLGGFMWLVSGGGENVKKGKEFIIGALSGLVLVLGSYVFLVILNPNLIKLDLAVPDVKPFAPGVTDICSEANGNESVFQVYGDLSCLSSGTCPGYEGARASFSGVELESVHPGLKEPVLEAVKTLTSGISGRHYTVTIKSARRSWDNQDALYQCYDTKTKTGTCPSDCDNHCVLAAQAKCTAEHIRGVAVDLCITRNPQEVPNDTPDLCKNMDVEQSAAALETSFSGKPEYINAIKDLTKATEDAGLDGISQEWWHYQKEGLSSPAVAPGGTPAPEGRLHPTDPLP